MAKLTANKLEEIRAKLVEVREQEKTTITVCGGTGCHAYGCLKVADAFRQEIQAQDLQDEVALRLTGCHGFCERGPIVVIQPEGIFYQRIKLDDIPEVITQTVLQKKVISRLLYVEPRTKKEIVFEKEVPFYKKQKRIIFENNGYLDPTDLQNYIALDGYKSLSKALFEMTSEEVIEEIKSSGLRGRGGGGFPTGKKWEICRQVRSETKYLICNADEGDPGAYMDRSLLEGNPHCIIEGMIIGAYAIGANQGYIYVRMEYPLAVENITRAIQQAREVGLLGDSILGSEFSFDIHVFKGAGAFVSGEETSLMASIEGRRAFPRQRPPFPAESGLWGKPTNINNVETWANVPHIIDRGAAWYSEIGTQTSKGTKIFSLVGKINNTGLVEVPMGITLKEIIYQIGGGSKMGKNSRPCRPGALRADVSLRICSTFPLILIL